MTQKRFRHAAWILGVLVLGIILWRAWIPNLPLYEAPRWDESDRAQDAFLIAQGFRHFNPLPFLQQLFFFQTWGPGFSILSQLPILLFGFSGHSLTLIPFLSLIFGCLAFASVVKERAGALTASAVSLFSAFWILNVPDFAPYFSVFLIDGWSIVGWTGIVIAGAVSSLNLLLISSWLLFVMKFQYYAVIFMASVAYVVLVGRRELLPFVKELLKPTWAKAVTGLIALAVLHVLVMKACGPIYGKPSWDQPRALRNPILYGFMLAMILLTVRREVFFRWMIKADWEAKYVKYFLFPTSVIMAIPYPNRWAAVTVTQNQQDDRGFLQKVVVYSEQITSSLHAPTLAYIILLLLVVAFLAFAFKSRKSAFSSRGLPFFVSFLIIVHLFVLLGAVKHMDIRYALSLFLSIPIGLLTAVLMRTTSKMRPFAAGLCAAVSLGLLIVFGPLNSPEAFFTGGLKEFENKAFMEHANLFPLDQSLGPIVEAIATQKGIGREKDKSVRLGILSDTLEWDWNLSMRIWPQEFEAHRGIWVEPTIIVISPQACSEAAENKIDVLVKAGATAWETVPCAQ